MTRFALSLFTMTLVFGGTALAEPTLEAETRPQAVVEEDTKDVGVLPKGQTTEVTFTLRNAGNADLRILGVESSCGCTVTDYDEVIPPGARGEVRATLDSQRLIGPSTTVVTVRTNDPNRKEIRLNLKAQVEPRIAAFPGHARWNYVRHEPVGAIDQTVGALDGEEFQVLRVEAPAPYVLTSFRPATEEEKDEDFSGSQWRILATLSEDAPVGPLAGYITVLTDHPVQELLEIPVSGFVRPVAHFTPQEGEFGKLELSRPRTAQFDLTNFATAPMKIVRVDPGLPGLDVDVQETDPGRRFRVVLTFDPAKVEEGDFEAVVRLHTDNEHRPVLELPISGTLTPARTASSKPSG